MMIRVMYQDSSYDIVKSFRLNDLIPAGRIAKFLRSDGWVTIGVDPVRSGSNQGYTGPERRRDKASTVKLPSATLTPSSKLNPDVIIPGNDAGDEAFKRHFYQTTL